MRSESLSGKTELKLAETQTNASEVGWLLLTPQETQFDSFAGKQSLRRTGR